EAVSSSTNGAANELFVRIRTVNVRGVEHRDAQLERPMNGRDRFGFIPWAVELRHAHAAKAERGDDESLCSECSLFHGRSLYHAVTAEAVEDDFMRFQAEAARREPAQIAGAAVRGVHATALAALEMMVMTLACHFVARRLSRQIDRVDRSFFDQGVQR